jgi:hypothetical protein
VTRADPDQPDGVRKEPPVNHIRTPRTVRPARRAHAGRPIRRRVVGTLVAVVAVTTACGDDIDPVSSAACDRYADLQAAFFGDPTQLAPAAEAFAEAAPHALADDVDALVAAFGAEGPDAMGAPEFVEANQRIGDAIFADCDTVVAIDVDGIDYAFAGLPESVDAGRIAVRLHNASETGQPHEIVVVTGAAGQSAEELRELPMEELIQQARPVGLAFVDTPGASATTLIDLEPGSYLLICSLPVAEGGELPEGDGPPTDNHAAHGMVATLTVV